MKAAWIALVVVSLLAGCQKEVDQSQIEMEGRKVYVKGEDKPFTGTVLNLAPSEVLTKDATNLLLNWNQFASFHSILSSGKSDKPSSIIDEMMRTKTDVFCEASFADGILDGRFACSSGRKKNLITGEFKEGVMDGEFYVFNKEKTHKLIEANFENALLEGKLIYRAEDKDLILYSREVRQGLANGTTKQFFYNTGKIAEESTWTQGKRSGDLLTYDQAGRMVRRKTPDEKEFVLNDVTGNYIPVSELIHAKYADRKYYLLLEGKEIAAYMEPGVFASSPSYRFLEPQLSIKVDGCFEGWCSVDRGLRWVKEDDLKALTMPDDSWAAPAEMDASVPAAQETTVDTSNTESMKPYYKDMFLTSKKKCSPQNYTDECVPMEPDEYATDFELMIDENIPWTTDEILQLSSDGISKFYGNMDVDKNDTARTKLRQELCGKYRHQLEKTDDMQVCLSGGYGE